MDNRISRVTTNSGRVQANYFFENSNLKYILYHREDQHSDSIAVQYYPDGNNIKSASWFKFNQKVNKFEETSTVYYTYDNKINPYKNSIHFLYDFYDGEEFSLDYFNKNNLKTIKSKDYELHSDYIFNYNLHAEYIYNENDYPVSVIFYNESDQVTDRNDIAYNCQ